MKPESQARSGRTKQRLLLFLRTVICGLSLGSVAAEAFASHAAAVPKSTASLAQRVAKVRQALEGLTSDPNRLDSAAQQMQWNNWRNWPNQWGNWSNWNNWRNWINW